MFDWFGWMLGPMGVPSSPSARLWQLLDCTPRNFQHFASFESFQVEKYNTYQM